MKHLRVVKLTPEEEIEALEQARQWRERTFAVVIGLLILASAFVSVVIWMKVMTP